MFLKPAKTRSSEGVYFLRTNLQEKNEKTMWNPSRLAKYSKNNE